MVGTNPTLCLEFNSTSPNGEVTARSSWPRRVKWREIGQVKNARVFATAKGWIVLEEHIYIDDGTPAIRPFRIETPAN